MIEVEVGTDHNQNVFFLPTGAAGTRAVSTW